MDATADANGVVLDLRTMPDQEREPAVMAAYTDLGVGASLIITSQSAPEALRARFDSEHPGSHNWQTLEESGHAHRVRITKLTATPLPRIVADTGAAAPQAGRAGAVWRLPVGERDLDSNIIALPPGDGIDAHDGPEVDVLIHVLAGDGVLGTEGADIGLHPGALVWLPRRSKRRITAGSEGLRYLTVHRRRRALALGRTRTKE